MSTQSSTPVTRRVKDSIFRGPLTPNTDRERKLMVLDSLILHIHPSTLPVKEAIESLTIALADFMKPRRKLMERLPDIHIAAKSFTLVFVPFNEEHHEFIHHDYQIAINKNVMAHSKNL